MNQIISLFLVFFRLGLTSFGGPMAHLGFFQSEFVKKRKWFTEESFGDIVALCQLLPGPTSSQVGMAIGLSREGIRGAFAAWLGFTLPSAFLLIALGLGLASYSLEQAWVHGLKIAAVAVVAHAIFELGKKFSAGPTQLFISILGLGISLLFSFEQKQFFLIIMSAAMGAFLYKNLPSMNPISNLSRLSTKRANVYLILFCSLLVLLPLLTRISDLPILRVVDSFFRAGSLVFGGGHVVLPLLKAEVVDKGWTTDSIFVAGYGAAQAIPGPLFAFAGFLGANISMGLPKWIAAIVSLVSIFIPSFLLVFGIFPHWENIKKYPRVRGAIVGINAMVVGLVSAAFCNPIWTQGITSAQDGAIALICVLLLFKLPTWVVVPFGAVAASLASSLFY